MVQHEQDGGSTGASSGMGSGDAANTSNLPTGRNPGGQSGGGSDKDLSGGASSGMTGEKEYDTSAAGTSGSDEGPDADRHERQHSKTG